MTRTLSTGLWAAVGGQSILIRLNLKEVRQQFIYTAGDLRRDVSLTEEEELHWIPRGQVLNRKIPFIFHRFEKTDKERSETV